MAPYPIPTKPPAPPNTPVFWESGDVEGGTGMPQEALRALWEAIWPFGVSQLQQLPNSLPCPAVVPPKATIEHKEVPRPLLGLGGAGGEAGADALEEERHALTTPRVRLKVKIRRGCLGVGSLFAFLSFCSWSDVGSPVGRGCHRSLPRLPRSGQLRLAYRFAQQGISAAR